MTPQKPTAAIGPRIDKIAICGVRMNGEQYIYLSDKARKYLVRLNNVPKPRGEER